MKLEYQHLELCNKRIFVKSIIPIKCDSENTIIFLHEALGSTDQWKGFPEEIAQKSNTKCVIIEREGHGNSSPLSAIRKIDYLFEESYIVLPKILEILKIKSPIIIGHSDGGTIALLFASRFKTEKIISISAHVFVEKITLEGVEKVKKNRAILIEKLRKYHDEKAELLFDEWWRIWLSPQFRTFNIEKEISKIKAPLLVIQSKEDKYGSLEQVKSILKNVQSSFKKSYLLEKAGHSPHLEEPELVSKSIIEFINT